MRLRTQLGLFFLVTAVIILALGGLTVWGGSQIVRTFSQSLENMEKVSRIRSLQVLLTRQKASLDSFFLISDPQELERFDELSSIVSARLSEFGQVSAEDPRIQEMNKQYSEVLQSTRGVLDLFRRNKNAAFKRATDELLPKVTRLFDHVNQVEGVIANDVRDDREQIRYFVTRGGRIALLLGLFGALVGLFFAVSTFRSLTRSLQVLQQGATAFGTGQWDHRIDLSTRDELGDLARSFNEMAHNIKQLEMQTVHMHRMSAVGQLAGGVAHEINNPLTGVLGQAQLLLEKLPADDPRRSQVEKIERAAVRCKKIVRSLLDFSRQKETPFDNLNVNELIEATLELCGPDIQTNRVTVVKNLGVNVPPIMGNSSQLQQVFLNILSNSVQAMPKGGTLTATSQLGHFVPPNRADGKKIEAVIVTFSDTGIGIDKEYLSHVFEPFFTTKEIGKGTGLGLSVSLGIVRNHGGTIEADSRGKDQGASFKLYLPVTHEGLDINSEPLIPTGPAAGSAPETRFGASTNTRY